MENRFSICLNHGGKFDQRDSNSLYDGYDGSAFKIMRDIDADLFGYMDLVEEVDKLGYKRWDNLYYKIPGVVGEGSIKLVCNDVGVMEMIGYAAKGVKYFDVFVDGCKEEEESVELKCNEKEGSEYLISGEDSSEDEDFLPIEESSSEDGESENGLASEDEEYVEARRNIIKYKKWKGEDDKISHPNNLELAVLEEIQSDYADSDCEQRCIGSDESDDFDSDEGCFVRKRSKITYDPNCDHKKLDIRLGMRFESIHQCKRAVQKVAIINGYDLRYVRTNKGKLQARCVEGCPWRLYASFIKSEGMFAIKTLVGDHTCNRDMHTKQATADWIACEYLNTFRSNPNMTIAQLGEDIMKNFAVEPTRWKLYRGKWKALQMLRGSVVDHYAGLRSYMAELQRVDKEGRFEFLLADDSVFRAMYIGFSSLRKGFLGGCRPVLGFDGCFLKTFLGGALLCATAKDGNNQMYPVAWAVVEAENQSCWTWFLGILFDELGISDGLGYTFVSDQQKGLMNAIMELTPYAEHRNCARHVYMNWKKHFKGKALKSIYWRIVLSTHIPAYNIALGDLKAEDEAAQLDLLDRDPSRFCKAFISTLPRSDMVENNISETFNGYIVKFRGKHIIDMLECIRSELMQRQYNKLMKMSGVDDSICPRIRKKLEDNKYECRNCVTKPAVGEKFQVACQDDQFVVDLSHKTCSCRYWDLTGIPCIHACSAIHFLHKNAVEFVDECYRGRPRKSGSAEAPSSSTSKRTSNNASGRVNKLPVKRNLRKTTDSIIQKERAMARKGFGVLHSEVTGNTYIRMSNERGVHCTSAMNGSTSTGNNLSTQDSTI